MKNMRLHKFITIILLIFISNWPVIVNASTESIGKIILAVGDVTATALNGDERKLKRRSKIFSGDTLSIKSGARCQIRFSDKSLVALTENSIFRVDEYSFNQNKNTQEKAIYSLLKGGLRSISGAIGKKNHDDYLLNTPVATIGIRGTVFNIGLINKNDVQNLYGTVDSGAIVIKNEQGSLPIQTGQNFLVPKNQPPRLIISLPLSFPSNSEQKEADESSEDDNPGTSDEDSSSAGKQESQTSEQGDDLTEFSVSEGGDELISDSAGVPDGTVPYTSITSPDPTTTPTSDIITTTGTIAPFGAAIGFALTGMTPDGVGDKNIVFYNKGTDEVYIDMMGGVGNIPVAGAFYQDDCNPCAFIAATGSLNSTYVGGDGTLGVNWGRWSDDYVITENGIPTTNMGDFHYIYSPNVTPDTVLQSLTGTSYYYQIAGGTQPTDQNGATGTLTTLSIDINFSTQVVENINMGLSTPSTGTIDVSAIAPLSIPISDLSNGGIALESANGFNVTTGYVGHINGTLIGPSAEGLMTTYGFREDRNPSTKAVSGTALITQGGV